MLQISLDQEELVILTDVLQCCLIELRSEIHHTDDMDYKDMLKNRKQVLEKILSELMPDGEIVDPTC